MGFRLEVTKKHNPEGAEMEYVSRSEITLGNALEMIVCMFCSRGRRPVLVTELGPHGVAIYFWTYVVLRGDKPIILPDQFSGYSGGFGFRFTPLSGKDYDYDQLIEMVTAFLIAFPELASVNVEELMRKAGLRAA